MPHFHALVATPCASTSMTRLCQSLCSRVPVMQDGQQARLEFPFGQCRLRACENGLLVECRVAPGQSLQRLQCALTDRLRRCSGDAQLQPEWSQGLLPAWVAA